MWECAMCGSAFNAEGPDVESLLEEAVSEGLPIVCTECLPEFEALVDTIDRVHDQRNGQGH